jgi:plastocyanin
MSRWFRVAMTSFKLLPLACVTAALVAGCTGFSTSHRATAEESRGRNNLITVQTFQFRPTPIEVKAGTRVTWTNQDDILHTVTSGAPDRRDQRFESALGGKGTSYSFTFTQAGTYPYFCDRHQSMRGEVLVR